MRVETSKQGAWSRLVKPVLWPVLMAQAALVALCLVIGLSGWWLQASWSASFWLLLALLLGGGLNTAVFLMLLKQRLRAEEGQVEATWARLIGHLQVQDDLAGDAAARLGDPGLPIEERLEALAQAFEGRVARYRAELEAARGAERRLADDLQTQRGRLARLETGQVRAREESRLKSGYLAHLQQTLTPLLASVTEVLESDLCRPGGGERDAIQRLHDRLTDTAVLLENLGESPAERHKAVTGRVLVVDDGPVNLMLAQQVLERHGLRVATATNGAEALARLDQEPFDLVFMDIYMADMDGVETCRTWREREAELPERPHSVVVALTANAGEADRRRFREAGMDDYLAKPYRPQDLLERVRYWLPGTLAEMEARA